MSPLLGFTHRLEQAFRITHESCFPEAERSMLLEGSHAADETLVLEMRKAPLHHFIDLRTRLVKQLSELLEDRAGELSRLSNVDIEFRITLGHVTLLD